MFHNKLINITGKPEFIPEEVVLMKCCDNRCLRKVSLEDIGNTRETLCSKSEVDQNQYILDYMNQHLKQRSSDIVYVIGGTVVCEGAWRLATGIKRTRFKSLKDKVTAGVVVAEHGRSGMRYTSVSTSNVISWMSFKKVGDRMPMKEAINLPSCLCKQDVFTIACEDLTKAGLEVCGRSTFFRVWTSRFGNVVIPKVSTYHATYCALLCLSIAQMSIITLLRSQVLK